MSPPPQNSGRFKFVWLTKLHAAATKCEKKAEFSTVPTFRLEVCAVPRNHPFVSSKGISKEKRPQAKTCKSANCSQPFTTFRLFGFQNGDAPPQSFTSHSFQAQAKLQKSDKHEPNNLQQRVEQHGNEIDEKSEVPPKSVLLHKVSILDAICSLEASGCDLCWLCKDSEEGLRCWRARACVKTTSRLKFVAVKLLGKAVSNWCCCVVVGAVMWVGSRWHCCTTQKKE